MVFDKIKSGNHDEWNKTVDGEDLKIYYKKNEGSKLYTFYFEKTANAPLFNVISVMAEI